MENILGGITIPSHRSAIDFTKPSTRKSPWNPCPSKGQQEPFKQVLEYRLASGNFYSPHWTSIIEPRLCEEQRAGTSEQNMKDYWFLGRSLAIESVVPCIRIEISGSGDPPIEETSATELLTEDEVILPYRKYESIDWKQVHQYVSFRYKRFPPTAIVLSIAEGGPPGGRWPPQDDGCSKILAADSDPFVFPSAGNPRAIETSASAARAGIQRETPLP
jgi:hypothetical protein